MARVKRGTQAKRKHKKFLQLAKGYRGSKSRLIKSAQDAVLHAGEYAFHGRKRKKRDNKRLWNLRISQASTTLGLPYNQLTHYLKVKNIHLNSKMLANLVLEDFNAFRKVVEKAKS